MYILNVDTNMICIKHYFRSNPSVNSIKVTRNWKFDTCLSCEVAGRNGRNLSIWCCRKLPRGSQSKYLWLPYASPSALYIRFHSSALDHKERQPTEASQGMGWGGWGEEQRDVEGHEKTLQYFELTFHFITSFGLFF